MSVWFPCANNSQFKLTGAGLGQQANRSFPKALREAHGAFFFHAFAGFGDQARDAVV